jgi:dUTP pyrophosphatase
MSSFTGKTFTDPVFIYLVATEDVPNDIIEKYKNAAEKHNQKIYSGDPYVDSGFDLFHPKDQDVPPLKNTKLNLGIRCAAFTQKGEFNVFDFGIPPNPHTGNLTSVPKAFTLNARSSLGKTSLRLANQVGIIDRGYRGELKAIVDNINCTGQVFCNDTVRWHHIKKGDRLFQICMPDLEPFIVKFCEYDTTALNQTERGSGGFGSTGRN